MWRPNRPFGRLWRKLDPTGPGGLLVAALAGMYGVSIANLLPSYVDAWIHHMGISERTAGEIATVNMLAHATGLCATLRLATRWSLPRIAYTGLLLGVTGDLASACSQSLWVLAPCRALSGVGLGLQFGAILNWFSRNSNSTRGFGLYALLQFLFSAVFFVVLPPLESTIGASAIYLGVMPFALLAGMCLGVLDLNGGSVPLGRVDCGVDAHARQAASPDGLLRFLAVLAFAAFNIAAMGTWAFMQQFGESTGLSPQQASRSLALCSLTGIVGGLTVIAAGSRFGRLAPLLITLSVFAFPFAFFSFADPSPRIFVIGQLFIGLTWTMIIPYFEDVQSALDRSGRLTVLGMMTATLSAAAGPWAFGLLLGRERQYGLAFALALLTFALSALCSIHPAKVADARTARPV